MINLGDQIGGLGTPAEMRGSPKGSPKFSLEHSLEVCMVPTDIKIDMKKFLFHNYFSGRKNFPSEPHQIMS